MDQHSFVSFLKDGRGKSPRQFNGKEYLFQETPRPGNMDHTDGRGPRYFKIRMRIKIVEVDEFLGDMARGQNQQFEYLLR